MVMKKNIILFFLILFSPQLIAQENRKHEIRAKAGATSNVEVLLGASYQFMLNKYIGITGGADVYHLLLKEMRFIGGIHSGKVVNGDRNQTNNLLFNFSGTCKIPLLRQNNETVLYMHFEPGFSLKPMPNSFVEVSYLSGKPTAIAQFYRVFYNQGGEWFNLFFNNSISIDLDDFQIHLGYSISNYDPYGGLRNITIETTPYNPYLPRKQTTHYLFAAIIFNI
jgi:hypothetical protein